MRAHSLTPYLSSPAVILWRVERPLSLLLSTGAVDGREYALVHVYVRVFVYRYAWWSVAIRVM